jgi:type I restriction enzyme S subunit
MSKNNKILPEIRFPKFEKYGEWEQKELSQLGNLINGLTYSPKDVREKGLLVLRSSNVQNGVVDFKDCVFVRPDIKGANLSEPNDILVCVRNGSKRLIGKNALIPIDISQATHGAFMTMFRAKYPEFVFQLFQSEAYDKQVKSDLGATINSINGKNFLKYKFLVPRNPKEQQRIASCLSSLDELIAAYNDKLNALKEHKKGLMQNLFPQEGQKVPNYRFPEFENDGEWIFSKLNEISDISSGGTPSRAKKEYWNGNIPWVTTTLIDFNEIKNANELITPLGLKNSSTKIFPKGTILMAMYGQGKTRGKVAVLDFDAAINQACAAIKLKTGMNINFIFQNLASRYDEIRSISNQGGQENLSGELVKNIPICYPNRKSGEQQKIASCLSALDETINAQSEKIEQLQQHKKGLMQGLFPKIES